MDATQTLRDFWSRWSNRRKQQERHAWLNRSVFDSVTGETPALKVPPQLRRPLLVVGVFLAIVLAIVVTLATEQPIYVLVAAIAVLIVAKQYEWTGLALGVLGLLGLAGFFLVWGELGNNLAIGAFPAILVTGVVMLVATRFWSWVVPVAALLLIMVIIASLGLDLEGKWLLVPAIVGLILGLLLLAAAGFSTPLDLGIVWIFLTVVVLEWLAFGTANLRTVGGIESDYGELDNGAIRLDYAANAILIGALGALVRLKPVADPKTKEQSADAELANRLLEYHLTEERVLVKDGSRFAKPALRRAAKHLGVPVEELETDAVFEAFKANGKAYVVDKLSEVHRREPLTQKGKPNRFNRTRLKNLLDGRPELVDDFDVTPDDLEPTPDPESGDKG